MADQPSDIRSLLGPSRLAFLTPVREYPPLADRKAGALVTANALIASVVMFLSDAIRGAAGGSTILRLILLAAVAGLMALLLTGGYFAFRGLIQPITPMPRSLAYYVDIAREDREAYATAMATLDHRQALHDILNYNHSIATQSAAKFGWVQKSVKCLRIAIPLWMVLLLVTSALG